MPEGITVAPPPEVTSPPDGSGRKDVITPEDDRRASVRKKEFSVIVPRMLSGEIQKAGSIDRNARSPGEKALLLYDQLGKGIDVQRTEPFIGGKPLLLPEFGLTIDDGTDQGLDRDFADGEAAIAGISSLVRSPDGDFYVCPLKDAKTNEVFFVSEKGDERKVAIELKDGEDEKAAFDRIVASQEQGKYTLLEAEVPVAAVAGAQLDAESTTIADALDDDKKKLLEPIIASLPQNDPKGEYQLPADIDASLENVAQQQGLPTADTIKDALERKFSDKKPEDVTAFLSKLAAEGKILLDKSDFSEGMKLLGIESSVLITQRDDLLDQRSLASKKLAELEGQGVPAEVTADVKKQIEDIDAQMIMLQATKEIWDKAEKDGNSPVDAYYDKVMNGELSSEAAKGVMDGIRTGNLEQIIDSVSNLLPSVPEIKGLSGEQREIVMKYLKNGAKGISLVALVMAALAAASVVVVGGAIAVVGQGTSR